MPVDYNAKVKSINHVTQSLFILRVDVSHLEMGAFVPGQYTSLGLKAGEPRAEFAKEEPRAWPETRMLRRAYSVSDFNREEQWVEFYITMVEDGTLTPRLVKLQENSDIYISAKFSGHFVLDERSNDKNLIFSATGTGLAPFLAMIQAGALNSSRKIALLHGVRYPEDLGYRSVLETLEKENSSFKYLPCVSRAEKSELAWDGERGYVQELLEREALVSFFEQKIEASNTHAYLCGSPAMIDSFTEALKTKGLSENSKKVEGEIFSEKYWS